MDSYLSIRNNLSENNSVISKKYIEGLELINPIVSKTNLFNRITRPLYVPASNLLTAVQYSLMSLYDILRVIGNLLLLNITSACNALIDLSSHTLILLESVLMIPVNMVTHSISLITSFIATWISPNSQEPTDTLIKSSFIDLLTSKLDEIPSKLNTPTCINQSQFLSPYDNVLSFFYGLTKPLNTAVVGVLKIIEKAITTIAHMIGHLLDLLICKPKHALEDLSNIGTDLLLTTAVAIMTPINILINLAELMTRLIATWSLKIMPYHNPVQTDAIIGTPERPDAPADVYTRDLSKC